jgi:serine phosphatase RsbU (regulator of sigma subunit)
MAETKARQNARQLQSTMDTLAEIKESYREVQLKNELKDLAIREEQLHAKANRHLFYFAATALVLLIFILLLVYYQFRQKKKANRLLEDQKFEIEKQRDLANEQKQKITDSIQYAQRIQNAILPPKPLLEELIEDHFILFIPKDIVSGDFYWLTQKENILVLAVADCTGHGVPGALMSMLGIAFLNEIVNKIAINRHISSLQSDEILNELRRNIIVSLHQTGNIDESMDGMDIALCIIDFETDKLQYSGAHNPLYLIRDGELIQYDGDKMPLGYHKNKDVPFTRHDIKLKKGDMLYVSTDGYIDQFGGEQGFKFFSKNLKKLLLQIHRKPINEQKQILLEEFVTWRGKRDQLDDILLLGFRFTGRRKLKRKDEKYSWEDKQILIAEDTDVNYYLLSEALRFTKATLIRVKTGKEAVEFCKSNYVDLILMDIRMPEMNGYEATAAIKSFKKEIPIIVQTALGDSDEKDNSAAAGADDYISKPIDMKSFLIKLEHYLD